MKKVINLFSLIAASSLLLLTSCDSKDKSTETVATTEVVVPDTSQTVMPDQSGTVNMDTSTTASKTTSAAKAKKGKVSGMMMENTSKNAAMNKDKEGYYGSVEILPMFPGGQSALDDFIGKNIEYPETANENGIEGVVNVYFAVDETGKLSNAKIMGKPLGYGLEEEVLKAVNKMPTWTPGKIKGKNVKTYYTLPVNFKLEQ